MCEPVHGDLRAENDQRGWRTERDCTHDVPLRDKVLAVLVLAAVAILKGAAHV